MREIALDAARRHAVATQRFAARRRRAQHGRARGLHRAPRLRPDRLDLGGRPLAAARARRALRPRARRRPRRAAALGARVRVLGARGLPAARRATSRYFRLDKRADRPVPALVRADPRRSTRSSPTRCWRVARERGEIASRDFGGAGQRLLGVDAGQARARRALDGRAARDRRPQGHRAPLRPARARLPATRCSALPDPTPEETHRWQIETRRARPRHREREPRSPTTAASRASAARSRPAIEELVAEGVLERLRMRELGRGLARARRGRRARDRGRRRARAGAFLLSPFDNLLWDRIEAEQLFGFEHRLEIYKRPHERIYGYYVLPLLDGDEVVGRIDLKADRKAGTLRALAVHWQKRPRPRALREALARLGARARAREERDPEWSLRRARSTPGRSPTR